MGYKHYFGQTEMFASNVQFGYPCPRGGGQVVGLVYLAPRPGFGSGIVISKFLLHQYLGIFSCKRYKHYFCQTEMFTSNVQFGYPCPRGGGQAVQAGLSCPPAQDLSQVLSSVNSYCTITLEYLVVRDVNIISVKLRYLHLTFSSVILVRGVGGKLSRLVYLAPRPGFESGSVISQLLLHYILGIFSCKRCEHYFSQTEMFTSNVQFGYPCPRVGGKLSRLVILPPAQDLSQAVSSVNCYCTISLEYLVVRDVNIISVKLRCLHLTFSSVILVRGVGGKLSMLVYLAPSTGFGSNSVIS